MKKINYYILKFLVVLSCFAGSCRTKASNSNDYSLEPKDPLLHELKEKEEWKKNYEEKRKNLEVILQNLHFRTIMQDNFQIKIDEYHLISRPIKKVFNGVIDDMITIIPPIYARYAEKETIDDYNSLFDKCLKTAIYLDITPEKIIHNLIDKTAKIASPDKLTYLVGFFLKNELLRIKERTTNYPPTWTSMIVGNAGRSYEDEIPYTDEEKFNSGLDLFKKSDNFAIYAAQKLYQKAPDKFDKEKNNFLGEFNILQKEDKKYGGFVPYTDPQVEKFKNAFLSMEREGKIKQFRRHHPYWFYGGLSFIIYKLLAPIAQKVQLSEFLKNYIDKKLNSN